MSYVNKFKFTFQYVKYEIKRNYMRKLRHYTIKKINENEMTTTFMDYFI